MTLPHSPQVFYCNACGKKCITTSERMMGGKFLGWRVCSSMCVREVRWRETLSMMGKEYYPDPEAVPPEPLKSASAMTDSGEWLNAPLTEEELEALAGADDEEGEPW